MSLKIRWQIYELRQWTCNMFDIRKWSHDPEKHNLKGTWSGQVVASNLFYKNIVAFHVIWHEAEFWMFTALYWITPKY
jgi:hypothetical protein